MQFPTPEPSTSTIASTSASTSIVTVANTNTNTNAASTSTGSLRLVSAFLQKLINMVDDPLTDELIYWSSDGNSFYVPHHDRFAKELLPKFFKHSNFSSFVRQLNMYNFHKIPHLQQGALRNDAAAELWQFQHEHFKKGRLDLLVNIVRKKPAENVNAASAGPGAQQLSISQLLGGSNLLIDNGDSSTGGALVQQVDMQSIVTALQVMREHQSTISKDLQALQASNQGLWAQAISARDRYKKQSETINKILQFLAGVFGAEIKDVVNPTGAGSSSNKNHDTNTPQASASSSSSKNEAVRESTKLPNSHKSFIFPKKKTQLLLGDGTIGSANFEGFDNAGNIELPLLEDDERDFLDFGDPDKIYDHNEPDSLTSNSVDSMLPDSHRFSVISNSSTTQTNPTMIPAEGPALPVQPLPLSSVIQPSGAQFLLENPFDNSMKMTPIESDDLSSANGSESKAARFPVDKPNSLPFINSMPLPVLLSNIPPLSPYSPSKTLIPMAAQFSPRSINSDTSLTAIEEQKRALSQTVEDSEMIEADIDAMQRSLQSLVQGMGTNETALEFDGDWNMDDFLASLSSQPNALPVVDTQVETNPFENEDINRYFTETPVVPVSNPPSHSPTLDETRENRSIGETDIRKISENSVSVLPARKKRKSDKISSVNG